MSVKDDVYRALKAPMIHARAQLYSKDPELILAWAAYGLTVWNQTVMDVVPSASVSEGEALLLRMLRDES